MTRHHCAHCVTDKSITEMCGYGDTALFFFRTVMDGVCDTNKCQCISPIEIYAVNSRVLKCWVWFVLFF